MLYSLDEAAVRLDVTPSTLRSYVSRGFIQGKHTPQGLAFDGRALEKYRLDQERFRADRTPFQPERPVAYVQRADLFNRIHHNGHGKLLRLLADPRYDYDSIGDHFGVTGSQVAAWHRSLFVGVSGVARVHERAVLHAHELMFNDVVFAAFYRAVRQMGLDPSHIVLEPIQEKGHVAFKKKSVYIQDSAVALRRGQLRDGIVYVERPAGDYGFFLIAPRIYYFIPCNKMPKKTSFFDSQTSSYAPYRNTLRF